MDAIQVLVADDHPVFRAGLRGLLESRGGFDVVAEAAGGEQALALTVQHRPHVVVMDLHMPGINGIETSRRISAAAPETAVLILTMFDDDTSVFAAIRAGARGYLLKGAGQAEIAQAIEAVARGEAVFGSAIADRMLGYFGSTPPRSAEVFPELTERERQVLGLLADGEQNNVIARRLGVSAKTVRNHVSNILAKLHLADRSQAALRAREAGLGQRDNLGKGR